MNGCIIPYPFITVILHFISQNLPPNSEQIASSSLRFPQLELHNTDDDAIFAHSEEVLQCILDAFTMAYRLPGHKEDASHPPATTGQHYNAPPPAIHITCLENMEHFPYPGSLFSWSDNRCVSIHPFLCTFLICALKHLSGNGENLKNS